MAIYEFKALAEEPEPLLTGLQFSPYRDFNREEWARLRADTPMTLVERDLEQLSGLMDGLSLDEVEQIYLPMSRLINLYVQAAQELHSVSSRFLNRKDRRVPFIIGIAGSVAVGKSTSARALRALLARWPDHPQVDLITTDGFLLPNAELERRGIMNRKGFPESFDSTENMYLIPATSQHPGGVNVLFLDGSVRFATDRMDESVWRAIGTISGHETVGGGF